MVTKISYDNKASLEFPAVTICNENKVHCGNLHAAIEECDDGNCPENTRKNFCILFIAGNCEASINSTEVFKHGQVFT